MRHLFLFGLLLTAPLCAQRGPTGAEFPSDLRQFLGLTEDQVTRFLAANDAHERWAVERMDRLWAVRDEIDREEIDEETAREQMDANAIAVRYHACPN